MKSDHPRIKLRARFLIGLGRKMRHGTRKKPLTFATYPIRGSLFGKQERLSGAIVLARSLRFANALVCLLFSFPPGVHYPCLFLSLCFPFLPFSSCSSSTVFFFRQLQSVIIFFSCIFRGCFYIFFISVGFLHRHL